MRTLSRKIQAPGTQAGATVAVTPTNRMAIRICSPDTLGKGMVDVLGGLEQDRAKFIIVSRMRHD